MRSVRGDDALYAAHDGSVYRVNPSDGSWAALPGDYSGTQFLAWALKAGAVATSAT